MPLRGAYCLSLSIEPGITVRIGALGDVSFEGGEYVYVGSAMNGIETRVRRHINSYIKRTNALHWHIDYLLCQSGVHLKAVHAYISDERIECRISEALSLKFQALRGFGSSDCGCKGHLFKIEGNWNPMNLGDLAKQSIPIIIENL